MITAFNPIAGAGLGTSQSSLLAIGALYPNVGFGQAKLKCFTNVANGNFVLQDHVLTQKEMNGELEFYYTYNSQAEGLDKLWHFSLDKRWTSLPSTTRPLGNTATLIEADGHETVYTIGTNNYYFAPKVGDGTPYLRFDEEKNQWIWYHPKTQITEIYNAEGRLLIRKDLAGRETHFNYNDQHQLATIVGPTNNSYEIKRGDHYLEIINSKLSLTLQKYYFDANGRLEKTELRSGYCINYEYRMDTPALITVTQTDGNLLELDYRSEMGLPYALNANNELNIPQKIMFDSFCIGQNKDVYNFKYNNIEHPSVVEIRDTLNFKTTLNIDMQQRLTKITQEQGYTDIISNDITSFEYTTSGQLENIIHPNSGKEHFDYDAITGLNTLYDLASF